MTQFRSQKKIFYYRVILIFIILLSVLGSIEIINRIVYSKQIRLAQNVDHRLVPNTEEDNSDGIRCNKQASDFKSELLNILFLGDSFVYGHKVAPQFAIPQQFETMVKIKNPSLPLNVANFGWHSSSPYLSYRLLRDIGFKYHPDLVFLCLDMTDFHDDLKYYYLNERPTLFYKTLYFFPGMFSLLHDILSRLDSDFVKNMFEKLYGFPSDHFFIVNNPLEKYKPYSVQTFNNINKINEYVTKTLKAKFILVVFPRSFQYSTIECPQSWEKDKYENLGKYVFEPFKLISEMKSKVKYPIYSLLEDFTKSEIYPTCFYDDFHWNEEGNRFAASKIYEIAKKENVFNCISLNPD